MNHGGQVSFPGGGWEPGDERPDSHSLAGGLGRGGHSPQDVQVLGAMQPIGLITGFCGYPVVGKIPWPYPIQIFDGEVALGFPQALRRAQSHREGHRLAGQADGHRDQGNPAEDTAA